MGEYSSLEQQLFVAEMKIEYPFLCESPDCLEEPVVEVVKHKDRRLEREKWRALRRKGDGYFIEQRKQMVYRHRVKGFTGDCITTERLIEMHEDQGGRCYYTGLRYDKETTDSWDPLHMTVDRIDNRAGYVEGNVCLCCWFVNVAKRGWPLEQMKRLWKFLPTE